MARAFRRPGFVRCAALPRDSSTWTAQSNNRLIPINPPNWLRLRGGSGINSELRRISVLDRPTSTNRSWPRTRRAIKHFVVAVSGAVERVHVLRRDTATCSAGIFVQGPGRTVTGRSRPRHCAMRWHLDYHAHRTFMDTFDRRWHRHSNDRSGKFTISDALRDTSAVLGPGTAPATRRRRHRGSATRHRGSASRGMRSEVWRCTPMRRRRLPAANRAARGVRQRCGPARYPNGCGVRCSRPIRSTHRRARA